MIAPGLLYPQTILIAVQKTEFYCLCLQLKGELAAVFLQLTVFVNCNMMFNVVQKAEFCIQEAQLSLGKANCTAYIQSPASNFQLREKVICQR